ncbi:MAG TPA: DEAD/DEAH box helicase [Solirubrobacterales bacterium]|nr:DEAD/DEAH box helicase [Solirubrobacterales bacterium]
MATAAKTTERADPLAGFSERTRTWFERSFAAPTPAQELGWPAIATGASTLICAPTGSGKTLAAFLWAIDRLASGKAQLSPGVSLVYVSPLKALSYDVERNLRAPLAGIGADLSVALRTGDTPQRERQAMLRRPPDILITTPESLYLMLTSQARDILTDVEAVIVDEIHAVAPTKRGAHMALTLERLERHVAVNGERDDEGPLQRIGLSATQRPLERIASFLVGPGRGCEIVDAGVAKELDLEIVVPVADMADPASNSAASSASRPGAADGTPRPGAADGSADGVELPGPDPGAPGAVPGDSPSRGIWPAIYPELLALVREHTSTIIFVNNRRAAERLAKRLNEMNAEDVAGDGEGPPPEDVLEVARAHHGSLAREERLKVEELLKSGQIPCIVATSSLELGIDMGAVDLVIQVESPKSVARGMQRVGRAGHELGAVSKGRIFPKFRSDLLECAVVAKRMRAGAIEETVIPRNPLDVLAQQIVAMVADEEWEVDEIERVVKSAEPYGELSREQLENVLDMLDGRYPSERFAELRPRIVWDRTGGTVRGRKGARQLAVTNAGTIPDRGLFGVHLPDGRRVGELDEEMVYEARAGQVFLLGASSWRIEEITRDRVIVTPAPGVPGAVPFWRGEGVGRPVELGRAIGEFSREAVAADPEELASGYDLDRLAAENLVAYLREQQAATRVVPSDQTIVVERFRDEIGDWRLCVLSPFGGRVHAAWGLALAARIRAELELEADAIWSDDGIVIHLPDSDRAPDSEIVLLEPDEVEDLIVGELSGTALFGSHFREAAGRALLIPRAYPGKRTPLWQQRLKSQSLLEVAKDFPRFPITLETYREVLRDVLDLPALAEILRDLKSRRLSLVEVETKSASPFASSLLFDYVATYMYEGDTPNAERRAAALALDRDLLRELLGQEELRELIDPVALADVEDSLQHRVEQARATDRDQLQVILRRLGDLTDDEADGRVAEGYSAQSMLAKLEAERRAVKVRIAGEERWIASEDGGLYRDALGVPVPSGLPDAFLETVAEPMETLLRRYARTHVPFPTAQAQRRYGTDPTPALKRLEAAGELVRGELLPGGSEREWCDPDVLRRLRRASLAVLRKEVEAADTAELARFLVSWQNVDAFRAAGAGPDRLREVLVPLQGVALTPEVWERDVLPRRLGAYSQTWLDQLSTGGEIVWIGAGPVGRTGRVAFYFREDVRIAGPPPANAKLERPEGEIHDAIRELLAARPCFWLDLVADLGGDGGIEREDLHAALWDLAWAGEVTNDAVAPLRAPRLKASEAAAARRGRRFSSRRNAAGQAVAGRWSLTAELFRDAPASGPRLRAQAELMLERYGIVTRETVLAEGVPGGFSALYGELSNLEMLGTARRGYFVEGLGGAQFALAGAVERLRSLPRVDAEHVVLAATDPAQPYGASLAWPRPPGDDATDEGRGGRRPSRVAGAYVVLRSGEPVLYLERGGKGLLRLARLDGDGFAEAIAVVVAAIGARQLPRLGIERIDGEPALGHEAEQTLIDAGFERQPRRLVAAP